MLCTRQRCEILRFDECENRRSVTISWIFDNKSGRCRFRYGADSLSVHYASENGEQSILSKSGFAGGSVAQNRPQNRINTRKKAPIFRWMLFGGDKRDRTADLLNAIQALSQLSYTPRYLPPFFDRLIIIAGNMGHVNRKRKVFSKKLKKANGPSERGKR